jgi:hypothetical protein
MEAHFLKIRDPSPCCDGPIDPLRLISNFKTPLPLYSGGQRPGEQPFNLENNILSYVNLLPHTCLIRKLPVFAAIALLFLGVPVGAADLPVAQGDLFYAWVSGLRVKDDSGKTIAELDQYDIVAATGKSSDKKETATLQGVPCTSPRYLVKTRDGKSGWIFGGGLKPIDVKPEFKTAAQKGFSMGVYFKSVGDSLTADSTNILDGAKLEARMKNIKNGKEVYKRPIFESGCVGMLHETCFTNNILEMGLEGGTETIVYGDSASVIGVSIGMTRELVIKKLGRPYKQTAAALVYRATLISKNNDGSPPTDYLLTVYFDNSQKVTIIKVGVYYNEDC